VSTTSYKTTYNQYSHTCVIYQIGKNVELYIE